ALTVGGVTTCTTTHAALPVLRGLRVFLARGFEKVHAERDGTATAHKASSGNALLGRDKGDRSELVILTPPPPVAAVSKIRLHYFLRGQPSFHHGTLLLHLVRCVDLFYCSGERTSTPATSSCKRKVML